MSESSNKILKAEIGIIKKVDLELFKNIILPFNGLVEEYNEENETAIVQFNIGIEKKHLEGLGNYTVKPMQFDLIETKDKNLRKRNINFIYDRVIIDEHDIISIFLNITLIAPVIFVLLSILILSSIF
ncbi:conserved Plasmodium protein, unknown function [Plasmodium gallinaceum]|uniref:Uncharacterized protein n=1 Tax=Plasmodium gallinaceum TaxID=5849 RepID=A0A1J1GNN2_PLAGA|nr:conserved Plasmodium protein, unknown function [Plasmodium gallinaceum]CRG94087.1 conserved Plasmodium protein, unknown function [Plasmodium gallinaceum]